MMVMENNPRKKSPIKKLGVSKKSENMAIGNVAEIGNDLKKGVLDNFAGKKLKTDENTVTGVIDKLGTGTVSITKEHQKIAFKGVIELDRNLKKINKNFLSVDELWEWIVRNGKGVIDSIEFLIKVVQDLDDKSKIVFNKADSSIYLL